MAESVGFLLIAIEMRVVDEIGLNVQKKWRLLLCDEGRYDNAREQCTRLDGKYCSGFFLFHAVHVFSQLI